MIMPSNETAIIILAAGGSTRMGTPKQLLQFEGRTLLRRAAQTALATDCRPVVVVLGASAETMRQELHGLDVVIVENANWQTGMAGSLRTGIKALGFSGVSRREVPGTRNVPVLEARAPSVLADAMQIMYSGDNTLTDEERRSKQEHALFPVPHPPFSCIIMLCDQPFVTPILLDTLRTTWRASGKPVVCCEYAGGAGVPALFDQSLFAALCGLQGAAGAKQIFARYAADTALVPFAAAAFDVDTPQEYAALTEGKAAL